ncbi:MAG: hypothetical protein M3373_01325 [Gemmatimonadota bacterium]|nr:hypothetical protein [Gemmatimonadota bacterium]
MRAVCIARHRILSDHYRAYFRAVALEAVPAVGIAEGMRLAREVHADLVLCDYDLLVATALDQWERDPVLASIPVVAVSLTRRPEEAHALDVNGVAGFLYLPTLTPDDAACMLRAATGRGIGPPSDALRWPGERGARPQAPAPGGP